MSETETPNTQALVLRPPEALQPVAPAQAPDRVPLDPAVKGKVEQ